jgi:hypothetical protein
MEGRGSLLSGVITLERDRSANRAGSCTAVQTVPFGNSFEVPGELLRLGHIAAHGQCQRRMPQSPHGLAITQQRVGTCIGLFKFGGGVSEPKFLG